MWYSFKQIILIESVVQIIMKEKLQHFMVGRYGGDDLSKFLMGAVCVLCILSMFSHMQFLIVLVIAGIGYSYFRMFSRNSNKRYSENLKYLELKNRFLGFFRREKKIVDEKRVYHIYKCPSCKQKIRVPRGKGKICVTCPKCRTEFTKRS